ncbi:putative purinergic receptor [Heterostelium album PN500]|uniref:Putative purinergic receptor n=1 Tax=Heterostelium pallidum (strain ATCC 26659 / Pp 5 / PN500) TaxID=670386 RepID=D3BDI2_HETP5|nr:putative purinergic receptor [Heterostelium album PN500]EFA80527.1 putative purinergic receptor [Heterostelium album PN500]|eukprot:XP_020432647.1 putative purinergic receptor [Heterostelium album PN500]
MGLADLFTSYETEKIVKIKDKRLKILHIIFLFAIFVYIFIFNIVLDKSYLSIELPIGTIRTSLQAPQARSSELPYCLNSTNIIFNGFPTMQCAYWDEELIVYPPTADYSMFVSTRVTTEVQDTPNCDLTSLNCTFESFNTTNLFIADIDNFTILLDHTLSAPSHDIQFNARELPGQLLDTDGKPWTPPPPSVVGQKGLFDILTLDTILEAAGIDSLDDMSLSNSSRSIRDDGIILLVFIDYSNVYTYNTNNYRYTYRFKAIKDTKFKIMEPIYGSDLQHRFVLNRHGVKLIFLQTGQIGAFDFQTLLLNFVSGLGLLAVATFIVENIVMKILPQRDEYHSLKYQVHVLDVEQPSETLTYQAISD